MVKTAKQDRQKLSTQQGEISDQQVELKVAVAVIQTTVIDIRDDVTEIKKKLEGDYVTKEEFDPIKKVVYGVVSLILTGVVGALIVLVVKR